jgi:3-hydroxyisobutyrate dehydrogenase
VSEALIPERVLSGDWPQTFRLALLHKDVEIARTFLKEVGVEGPMLDLAGELFGAARAELGETADHVEAIRRIERRAGVEIRS